MKKLMKCCFHLLLCLILSPLLNPINVIKAVEEDIWNDSIENNSIKLLSYHYPFDIADAWVEFKFVEQGDNTVKLKTYWNGNPINPDDLPSNLALYQRLHFIYTNIYGYEGGSIINRGTSMQVVAQMLEELTFTYNVDTIQIKRYINFDYNFSTEGDPVFLYEGKIHSNLHQLNFNQLFWFFKPTEDWQFRIRKEGLYAEYIPQDRIPDGDYIIESAECSNRVLDVLSENNIGVSDYFPNTTSQIFTLEYDDLHKAYKIRLKNQDKALYWDKNNGKNVIASESSEGSLQSGEQFWYLQDAGDGSYNIVSARSSLQFLNVDINYTNISVTENRNNLLQKFKFVKVSEKESLFDGQWKIVSKLNNDKILTVDISGNDVFNVAIFNNANVKQQKWQFSYNWSTKAYQISSNYNSLYLGWNPNGGSSVRTLSFYDDGTSWLLEYVGNGYYMFKNYRDQNMVLDIYGSRTSNGTDAITFNRRNTNNQQFKITR